MARRPALWIAGALCAALSLIQIGFHFPRDNNVFHLPIVLGLVDAPQFAGDPIIQSLRDFTAPLYRLLALVATEATIGPLFLVLHVVTRLASMVAVLAAALAIAGAQANKPAGLLAAAVALAGLDLLNGYALVGGHGLFIDYFTHSELTLPFIVAAIHLMARGRVVAALATCGVLFDVNAFVAVWVAVVLPGVAIAAAPAGLRQVTGQWRRWLAGGAVALVLALPTLLWIAQVQIAAGPSPIADFRAMLRFYYPAHFFIDAAAPVALACLAGLAAIAWLALGMLGAPARGWRGALLGGLGVLAAGAVAPLVTTMPMVLNLHLIRAAGLLQIIAMLALVALAVAATAPGFGALRRLAVLLAILPLTINVANPAAVATSLLATLVAAQRLTLPRALVARLLHGLRRGGGQRLLRPAMMVTLIALFAAPVVASRTAGRWRTEAAERPAQQDFAALVHWARANTDPGAMFLVFGSVPGVEPFMFRVLARRQVWVDRKSGASALWHPAIYPQWRQRIELLQAATSMDDALRFACRHGIDYLIAFAPPPGFAAGVFSSASVRAVAVASHCGGAPPR